MDEERRWSQLFLSSCQPHVCDRDDARLTSRSCQRRPPNASSSNGISSITISSASGTKRRKATSGTMWITSPLGSNMRALSFLHGVRGQLRPGAMALIAHDATDLETPAALTPIADYTELVLPSLPLLPRTTRVVSWSSTWRPGWPCVAGDGLQSDDLDHESARHQNRRPAAGAFLAAWKSSTREVQTIDVPSRPARHGRLCEFCRGLQVCWQRLGRRSEGGVHQRAPDFNADLRTGDARTITSFR